MKLVSLAAVLNFDIITSNFVIGDFKNHRVTVPQRIRAKFSKFHTKVMYLAAILNPPLRNSRF